MFWIEDFLFLKHESFPHINPESQSNTVQNPKGTFLALGKMILCYYAKEYVEVFFF